MSKKTHSAFKHRNALMNMSSEKKSTAGIIRMLINSIAKTPKSMYELAKELNSNWDTIRNNVALLEELKIVGVSDQKVFLKQDKVISMHDDAVAGLPLSDEVRKKIYVIASYICSEWKKATGEEPNNTQLQKTLVEVSEAFPNLNIPRGWYLYGRIVLIKVDKNKIKEECGKKTLKDLELDVKKFQEELTKIIQKIHKLSHAQLLDYQYSKYEKKDYLTKREIEELFKKPKFDKEKFANLLYKLIFDFKVQKEQPLNTKVLEIIKEASSVLITKSSSVDVDKFSAFKNQLLDTFLTFWKLYATYALLQTLEGDLGYDKKVIDSIFEERIEFYAQDLTDQFLNCALCIA